MNGIMDNVSLEELLFMKKANDLNINKLGEKYGYDVNVKMDKEDEENMISFMVIDELLNKYIENFNNII